MISYTHLGMTPDNDTYIDLRLVAERYRVQESDLMHRPWKNSGLLLSTTNGWILHRTAVDGLETIVPQWLREAQRKHERRRIRKTQGTLSL